MKTNKSKPKQRTNWKQRALHCEEVIGVQNALAKAAEVRMSRYIYSAAEAIKRAESAEKHNAVLLEERDANNKKPCCGAELTEQDKRDLLAWWDEKCRAAVKSKSLPHSLGCLAQDQMGLADPPEFDENSAEQRILNAIFEPTPTHWQRFKSWLAEHMFQLLWTMVLLCVLAGVGALAWPWR